MKNNKMEDIVIVSSRRSQAAELWVTYLKTCFDQIRKTKNKPPFRILSVGLEDLGDESSTTEFLDDKLKKTKLSILILCPVFLDHISQNPEHGIRLGRHIQPDRALAMLLGIDESVVTPQHKTALITYSQWRRMESVKDRDEKFVGDFLAAAMDVISKSLSQHTQTAENKCQFVLMPKKVNKAQNKVLVLLNEPITKEDVVRVTVTRNNEVSEISSVKKRNPYTLIFRMPEDFMAVSMLVNVTVERNGISLGSRLLKCESQLYAMDQILRSCDSPVEFMCQALNIVPCDKEKLDHFLVASFQRNIPPNFNLLHTSGLGQLHRGVIIKEEYPTLLHFAARYGLEKLCWMLLECPGGELACDVKNNCELTPAEIAESAGHSKLANVLCGYMQMTEFTSAYTLLKGMSDNRADRSKADTSEDYLNPRPLSETYQVPPSPKPLALICSQPPLGYMQMHSPACSRSKLFSDSLSEERSLTSVQSSSNEELKHRASTESTKRDDSEQSLKKSRENLGNGIQDELIEIINDFKNNVFTISEVEKLVENWRNRNDVQQSFKEKQEQLNKMREEYERVQQRMKDEMKDVGRLSPMERIRNFFRGKSKDAKSDDKTEVEKRNHRQMADSSYCNRPASSLSLQSSSSSSSGRLSTGSHCSGTSLGDSGTHSDAEPERKFLSTQSDYRSRRRAKDTSDNYDVPPSPISLLNDQQKKSNGLLNYDILPSPSMHLDKGFTCSSLNGLQFSTPPPTVVAEMSSLACNSSDAFYYNVSGKSSLLPNESALHGRLAKTSSKNCLKTVEEQVESKTEDKSFYEYINLSQPMLGNRVDIHLPEYVNIETQDLAVECK